jgi:hypothetical protein
MKPVSKRSIAAAFIADRLGICLSGLCLVHCLLTPLLLIALPSLSVATLEGGHHIFHEVLMIILPLVALVAFIPGFRRHHDKRVFYWSLPGLALLALAITVFHDDILWQAAITISGSVLLIRAHILNRHLCACCITHPNKSKGQITLATEFTEILKETSEDAQSRVSSASR